MNKVSINAAQQRYVFECGEGYPLLHGKAFQVTVGVGAAPGHSVALVPEAGSANTGVGYAGS